MYYIQLQRCKFSFLTACLSRHLDKAPNTEASHQSLQCKVNMCLHWKRCVRLCRSLHGIYTVNNNKYNYIQEDLPQISTQRTDLFNYFINHTYVPLPVHVPVEQKKVQTKAEVSFSGLLYITSYSYPVQDDMHNSTMSVLKTVTHTIKQQQHGQQKKKKNSKSKIATTKKSNHKEEYAF